MAKRKSTKKRTRSTRQKGWTAVWWTKAGVAKGKSRRYLKKSDAQRIAVAKRKLGFSARVVVQYARVKSKPKRKALGRGLAELRKPTKKPKGGGRGIEAIIPPKSETQILNAALRKVTKKPPK